MTRRFRTIADPSDVEGLEPGGELDGREVLDSRPTAQPVKPKRDQLGPLDQMYANIRAREQLARDQAHEETPDEQFDLDIPDEVDEFLSRYEEHPLDELLGAALHDKRVQEALRAALVGKYGEREALGLKEYGIERGNLPRQASTPASLPGPSKSGADPLPGGSDGPQAPPPPAAKP